MGLSWTPQMGRATEEHSAHAQEGLAPGLGSVPEAAGEGRALQETGGGRGSAPARDRASLRRRSTARPCCCCAATS